MDLDDDGNVDLLSGSWPGELFLFRGEPERAFAAPVKIKDRYGKHINIGGGVSERGDMLLVTGDGAFETDEATKAQVIVYAGERIVIPKGKTGGITGTASAAYAVDWDRDGDFDLLVGDIGGNVYLVRNAGTRKQYAFEKEVQLDAGGKPLHVEGDAGPTVADWDGDGAMDLLVGAGDGTVSFFRNRAKSGKPELEPAVVLVGPGENVYGEKAPPDVRRGTRSKVCAADWNGDGRLDLLVGDYASQKPPKPTAEQVAASDALRKELTTLEAREATLGEKAKEGSPEARAKTKKELDEITERVAEIQRKLPRASDTHGWVWLFLSRPRAAKDSR